MTRLSKTGDMTQGSPSKALILFAIPLMIGGIFQLMYNMADTVILGKFAGAEALAAIGATTSTHFLIFSFSGGITNAITVVVAQYFGAKDMVMLRKAVANSIWLVLGGGVVLGLITLIGARPLMAFLGTPAEVIDRAVIYLQIVDGLVISQLIYNGAAAVLRAFGDSKTPLYFLILCSFLNIGLDILFVLVFDMEVAGVAIATVIAQFVSAILCTLYTMKKYHMLRFEKGEMKFDSKIMGKLVTIGIPIGIQSALCSIGMLVITGVINSFGAGVMAAYTIGSKVEQLATVTFSQVAFSFSVYSGQNFGARQYERVKLGMKKAVILIVGLSLVSSAVMFFFGRPIVGLFLKSGEDFITEASLWMVWVEAFFYAFLGAIWLYNSALRGIDQVNITMVSAGVELACKIGLTILLAHWLGYIGIWLATPIGWVLGLIPSVIVFHRGKWIPKGEGN